MGGYSVERHITVNASPADVHRLVDDFRRWPEWSPWEDLDPDLKRTYSGAEQGEGARYEWSGNRKAGAGSMEIIGSTPHGVDITVHFEKPFRSTSQTRLSFEPAAAGTEVRWVMRGEQKGLMAVFGRFVSMDKMIGPDFEKGLARLKAVAEEPG